MGRGQTGDEAGRLLFSPTSARRHGQGSVEYKRRARVAQQIDAAVKETDWETVFSMLGVESSWLRCDERFRPRVLARLTSGLIAHEAGLVDSQVWQPDQVSVSEELARAFDAGVLAHGWSRLEFPTGLLLAEQPGPLSARITHRLGDEFGHARQAALWQVLQLRRDYPQAVMLGVATSQVAQVMLDQFGLSEDSAQLMIALRGQSSEIGSRGDDIVHLARDGKTVCGHETGFRWRWAANGSWAASTKTSNPRRCLRCESLATNFSCLAEDPLKRQLPSSQRLKIKYLASRELAAAIEASDDERDYLRAVRAALDRGWQTYAHTYLAEQTPPQQAAVLLSASAHQRLARKGITSRFTDNQLAFVISSATTAAHLHVAEVQTDSWSELAEQGLDNLSRGKAFHADYPHWLETRVTK